MSSDEFSPYTVVVRNWAYTFAHRDSYIRFLDELEKRGEKTMTHQGGILNSCEEGIALFEQLCAGDRWAEEMNRALEEGEQPCSICGEYHPRLDFY